jgi:hypothetical protein
VFFFFKFDLPDFIKDFTKHKLFFENYAKDNGFDPLVPENWYFQTAKNILSITVWLYNKTTTYTHHTTHTQHTTHIQLTHNTHT